MYYLKPKVFQAPKCLRMNYTIISEMNQNFRCFSFDFTDVPNENLIFFPLRKHNKNFLNLNSSNFHNEMKYWKCIGKLISCWYFILPTPMSLKVKIHNTPRCSSVKKSPTSIYAYTVLLLSGMWNSYKHEDFLRKPVKKKHFSKTWID